MDGNDLKELIRKRGYTYDTLGREIGISAQAVNEIVAGRTRGATARYAIAAALDVRVEDIWPEERDGAAAPAA